MFFFDTNVLSEVMKATPDPAVVNWLTGCPAEMMFTTTICQTEILYGLRRLPDSQRRQRLTAAAEALLVNLDETRLFSGLIDSREERHVIQSTG